jgi:DNA-binding MarR family transcriptional regulator
VARPDPHAFYERFSEVTKRVRAVAEEAFASFEVGSTQAKFLRHIGLHSQLSQADLARATGTAPTLTGRALESLIERGWVRRKRSQEDRREYLLELTASGHRVREKVERARDQIIRRIGEELDERDVADFDRIARKVLAALERSRP